MEGSKERYRSDERPVGGVKLKTETIVAESISGVAVVIRRIDLPAKELAALATSISDKGGVALIAGAGEKTVRVVLTSGDTRVNAGEIISQVCSLLGKGWR